ncbi:hypothetical protein AgCh_003753 [Apium graveolens]
MEAPPSAAPLQSTPPIQPSPIDINSIKTKLLKQNITPTPKIIHTLTKKHRLKTLRKTHKNPIFNQEPDQELAHKAYFQEIKKEYKNFKKETVFGKPWERLERNELRELSSFGDGESVGENLKFEHLRELGDFIEGEREKFRWLLDDDVEEFEDKGWGLVDGRKEKWVRPKRPEAEAMRFLVDKLSDMKLTVKDYKFGRMMKQSELLFTELQLVKILQMLGDRGQWSHALSVVEWVYNSKDHKQYKSRYVYTKLLAVLGRARRPYDALQIFNLMCGDYHIYPDMAAYHSIAVTLGQAGYLKDLVSIVERMKQKPSRKIKNMRWKNWDPVRQPDVVVYNAILNACVTSRQWKGVSWVIEEMRKGGLKPNGATFGLAMEVMLQSKKYDLVHEYFWKMKRSGEAMKALTYKVLVRAFREEGKVNEAVQAVREMEQRGLVGAALVYYELACCLCTNGRWLEAMEEIEKLKKLPRTKSLEVTFTGMILSAKDGGYIDHCICIFERSKEHCDPGIGIINAMLKIYGQNDMFLEARELFENITRTVPGSDACPSNHSSFLKPDTYAYSAMLEASAAALQWEYFENVYKEMVLCGYQLDQNKHAHLLVKASRNGKCDLLEHAFDTILGAGEIPHLSFFTEMVCQASAQRDYERAVAIVNTLAYAPFQVSEMQWKRLFEDNVERINEDILKELFDSLCHHELTEEVSVSNLIRVLQFLCGTSNATSNLNFVRHGEETISESLPEDYRNRFKVDVNDNAVTNDVPSDDIEESTDPELVPEHKNVGFQCNGMDKHNTVDASSDFAYGENVDTLLDKNSKGEELGDSNLYHMLDHNFPETEFGDSQRSDVPSANEILQKWKESRKKDGILFSFQLFDQV